MADLKWDAQGASSFELQERNDAEPQTFKLRYEGSDRASIRSGLAAGTHHFRVRAVDAVGAAGPWSDELTVEVTYMGAGRLRLLLILGGIVVLSTIGTILHGHFSHRKREGSR